MFSITDTPQKTFVYQEKNEQLTSKEKLANNDTTYNSNVTLHYRLVPPILAVADLFRDVCKIKYFKKTLFMSDSDRDKDLIKLFTNH